MKRVLVPTAGPCEWRRLLAQPDVQWKRGASAFETAVSWEAAAKSERGLPPELAAALDREPELAGATVLFALPEHKVTLNGRGRASQNDVWALLHSPAGYASLAIEAKAGEPFGPTIGEWLQDASGGKKERLDFLCTCLELEPNPRTELRYQLFHRTASAILEAQRCRAPIAIMLVQSLGRCEEAWSDFAAFCHELRADPARGRVTPAARRSDVKLFVGWVDCERASDALVAAVVEQVSKISARS